MKRPILSLAACVFGLTAFCAAPAAKAFGTGELHIMLMSRDVQRGTDTYLRAYVRDSDGQTWLPGKQIALSIDGTLVGSDITNADGRASVLFAVPVYWPVGDHAFTAAFSGDADYAPAVGAGTLTVGPGPAQIWLLSRDVQRGTNTYLRAYMRREPDLAWVTGREISMSIDGTSVGSDVTNSDGRASILFTVPADWSIGDHAFAASFAGDAEYAPAVGTGTLTVTRGPLYIWLMSREVQRGTNTYLRAYVRRYPDLLWVSGKEISLALDGTPVGTDFTNADGRASVLFAVPSNWPLGAHQFTGFFAGDADYDAALGWGTITAVNAP